ncbi:hypothetical protein MSPP1_003155 [Malassezia sp. CBS 17886]|nr:hypothetical protein MSPP1_003155 [Malassezia sp. CBS 17886]
MTTFLLDRVRPSDDGGEHPASCVFCDIITGQQPAHIVADTEEYIAFLDTLPIRSGHTLVATKKHIPRLTGLDARQAGGVMHGVLSVARAMERAWGVKALQVATNQVFAQTVDHVHFHVVPAPAAGSTPLLDKWAESTPAALFGRRGELGDAEGAELAAALHAAVVTARL